MTKLPKLPATMAEADRQLESPAAIPYPNLHTEVWTRFASDQGAAMTVTCRSDLGDVNARRRLAESAANMADALYAEWLKRVS